MDEAAETRNRRLEETQRRIDTFLKQGWYPAKTSHLPAPMRDELRRMGWRPQLKMCWKNCQRYLLHTELPVEYWEGWATILREHGGAVPVRHCWLKYEGQVCDLTIDPDHQPEYLGYPVSKAEVVKGLVRNRSHWAIFPDAINQLRPDYVHIDNVMRVMLGWAGFPVEE